MLVIVLLKSRAYASVSLPQNDSSQMKPSMALLTHFRPMFPFYTPWRRQKTEGFLTFSGGIKGTLAWNGLIAFEFAFL